MGHLPGRCAMMSSPFGGGKINVKLAEQRGDYDIVVWGGLSVGLAFL
jgi:hypothetical protein